MIISAAIVCYFLDKKIAVTFIQPDMAGRNIALAKSVFSEVIIGTGDELLADSEPAIFFRNKHC